MSHNQDRNERLHPRRSDRTRWVLELLREKLRRIVQSELLPKGQRIFDYGCRSKPYQVLFSAKFAEYVGGDLAGDQDADVVLGPKGEVPVPDESFDCVLSSQVLEHVQDPPSYLREARRILKAGGHLILSTHGIWPYHPDPLDYWRWTSDGLEFELSRAGFEPIIVHSVFGGESCALQLWQDATFERLPRWIQPLYTRSIQGLIGLIERRQPDKLSKDASVYVILARKVSE